jgi:PAS domain S-box-containing protein
MNPPLPIARRFALAAAGAATALGVFALATWGLGDWRIATFGPDYVPMAPITALLVTLLGVQLLLRLRWPASRAAGAARWLIPVATITVCALELARSVWGFVLPWDSWTGPGLRIGGSLVGRMSPLTATTLLLTATSFWASRPGSAGPGWRRHASSLFSGVAVMIAGVVALGYAAGTPIGYVLASVPMAMLTAWALISLNLGLLLSQEGEATAAGLLLGQHDTLGKLLLPVTLGTAGLMALAGFYYMRTQQAEARTQTLLDLEAIGNLKAQQVAQWRRERSDDARFLSRTPAVAADIAAFLARPGDAAARAAVLNWLEPIKGGDRYAALLLVDATGAVRLAIPETAAAASSDADRLAGAWAGREVTLGDLERETGTNAIHLDALAPVFGSAATGFGAAAGGPPLAGIILRVDPTVTLYPMLQDWPVATVSGELQIVRQEQDQLLCLNPTRSHPEIALNQRLPMVAAAAADGPDKVMEGRDYRGIGTLAAVRRIPDSPWILIAKVDQSEVYASQQREAWTGGALVVVLLTLVLFGAGNIARQRRTAYLQQLLDSEEQRTALAKRLALITDNANDIIFTFDDQMRIVDANRRAIAAYGYTAKELRTLHVDELRGAATRSATRTDFAHAQQPHGLVFETIHRRKDGSEFPVEVSSQPVEIEGQLLVLSVIRDITQRRAHELEIERLGRMYRTISHVNQALVHARDRAALFQAVCNALVQGGLFRIAWIGWLDAATRRIRPEAVAGDTRGYVAQLRVSSDPDVPEGRGPTGQALRTGHAYVCNDFLAEPALAPWHEAARQAGFQSSIALPIRHGNHITALLTVYAADKDFFTPRVVELLEETSGDLAFALNVFTSEAQRRASEERLKFLLTETPAIIYALRAGGDFGATFLSDNVRGVLGYEPAAFIADPGFWLEHVHPDDRAAAQAGVAQLTVGVPLVRDYRFRHADGNYRWMHDEMRAIGDATGQPQAYIGSWLDITAGKQSEQALQESEERYRIIAENTKDVIWLADLQTLRFTYVSPASLTIHGYAPGELVGRTLADIMPASTLAFLDRELRGQIAAYHAGNPSARYLTEEVDALHHEGRVIRVEIAITLMPGRDGRAAALLGVTRDITQRHLTETQLRKLSQVVEQAPLSVVITDLTGRIEYVNPTFTTVTGYTAAEAVGQNPRVLKSGETPREVFREMWSTLERGKIWSGELHNRRKNGEIFIENAVIAPVVDGQGRATHYVALKEDVTTQRRTIALLAKEREVSEMKSRFLSVTSHEFRTPMSAALGSVELLTNHLDRLTPEKRRELLDRITTSLQRMTGMLDEILLLNRIDAKRVEVQLAAQDLRLLVEGIIEESRSGDRGVHRFELAVEGDPRGFVTDANLLNHILGNLLSNAVRYSPAGEPVTVQLAVDHAGARLAVTDRGIGIPPADLARLFQPFERGSNVGNIKGTGLGLSIVKRMVELLGGTIAVEAPAEGGTRFAVLLPSRVAPAGRPH